MLYTGVYPLILLAVRGINVQEGLISIINKKNEIIVCLKYRFTLKYFLKIKKMKESENLISLIFYDHMLQITI